MTQKLIYGALELLYINYDRKLISDECFDLLNNLLEKNPHKRIDFLPYFNHKFFSEEHKKQLIKKYIGPIYEDNNKKIEEIKRISLTKEEFGEKYIKLILIKEYEGFKLYKAKDKIKDEIVYIKQIKREIIDKNKQNENLFTNEIILLSYLNGLHFPKCFGIYETKKFYFFIFEYFNGNFLDDFITKRKGMLNKSLEKSIIMQIESCFNKLKKNNIIIKNISSKCLVFSYYKNENNFLLKIFDYFINYIFFKQEKNSLIYKYEDFISNKKENDEKYKEYIENNNYSFESMKPVIKDEDIEIILIIIKYKIEFINNYFQELLKDKNNLETEMNSDYYKEIVIFLYFCFLECSIIINFLNINADKYSFEISKDEQEIHLLKINLSEDNNYEYSNINFLDDPKIWYYNKENPSFNYFIS